MPAEALLLAGLNWLWEPGPLPLLLDMSDLNGTIFASCGLAGLECMHVEVHAEGCEWQAWLCVGLRM